MWNFPPSTDMLSKSLGKFEHWGLDTDPNTGTVTKRQMHTTLRLKQRNVNGKLQPNPKRLWDTM